MTPVFRRSVCSSGMNRAACTAHGVDINIPAYPAMIAGSGPNYLIVPVKSPALLPSVRFNENKWQMSFVASLADQVLLFADAGDTEVDFNARLVGKDIAIDEDPPIGAAAPAFAAYMHSCHGQQQKRLVVQRGGGQRRKSLLEIEVQGGDGKMQIRVGGQAVLAASATFHLP